MLHGGDMDLNLRGVSDELVKTIKATAASEGQTMRDFVVGILERDVKRGGYTAPPIVERPTTGTAVLMDDAVKKRRETIKRKAETKAVQVEAVEADPERAARERQLEIAVGLIEAESVKPVRKCSACKVEMRPKGNGMACFDSRCHRFGIVMTP